MNQLYEPEENPLIKKKTHTGVNFAQTESETNNDLEEKSDLEEKTEVETSSETQVLAKTKESGAFFYVVDFFYWLGCKFVTCESDKTKTFGTNNIEKSE